MPSDHAGGPGAAAENLPGIGSMVSACDAAAAAPTNGVTPVAADEVSASTAAQFAIHAQLHRVASTRATAMYEMFVQMLSTSTGSYAASEAANTTADA